jgi:hypothetical protein
MDQLVRMETYEIAVFFGKFGGFRAPQKPTTPHRGVDGQAAFGSRRLPIPPPREEEAGMWGCGGWGVWEDCGCALRTKHTHHL